LAATVQEFEKTIINANSVFNVTKQELFEVSDTMVRFTLKYGVASQEMATGLYQLASAGLSAAESQMVLEHTMKLAMATQGDHNALAKLTVQVIMGFGMEMSDSAELVDKFAHSIQKSLIEWEDLASSVKFAMPFFVATGQSVDELLGGLEVLTNRALEAGIAGRGLRQALAQFAKHADDNASAMRKLGIEIMDTEGNMRALHDIALDASAAFGDVTDLEALTIMLEDMNVRGATAFALLVQNADEFDSAVKDIANSAGEATLMADIQQESLAMQIQRVKNALLAPFLLSDKIGEAGGSLNEFTLRIKELVDEFTQFFIIIGPDGMETYSKHGESLKQFVIEVLNEAVLIIRQLKDVFLEVNGEDGFGPFIKLLHLATAPMKLMLKILDRMGPEMLVYITYMKLLSSLLPVTTLMTLLQAFSQTRLSLAIVNSNKKKGEEIGLMSVLFGAKMADVFANNSLGFSYGFVTGNIMRYILATRLANMSTKMMFATLAAGAILFYKATKMTGILADALAALAGVLIMIAVFNHFKDNIVFWGKKLGPAALPLAIVAAMATLGAAIMLRRHLASSGVGPAAGGGDLAALKFNKERNYDLGGVYLGTAEGGMMSTEHGMAQLQKGETVVPKTQNMLGGAITLNFGDIHAQDGTDFAEKVASALPDALRRANDQGAI